MATLKGLFEAAIARMRAGEPPPQQALVDPNLLNPNPPVFVATTHEIPDNFVNPPPAPPLRGEMGIRLMLAQCGCNTAKTNAVIAQGFDQVEDFTFLSDKDYELMATNITRLPAADGGCIIGQLITVKMKAMARWCHFVKRQDKIIDAYSFDLTMLSMFIDRAHQPGLNRDSKQPTIVAPKAPSKFDPNKWVTWKESMWNYFMRIHGSNDVPLAYVICENKDPAATHGTIAEFTVYTTSHTNIAFQQDNNIVYQHLHECLSSTIAYTYIAEYFAAQNGRAAWQSLCIHYDGPGQVEIRIAFANKELEESFYKSEHQFPFESYSTRISNSLRILAENGAPKSERDKVAILLGGIKSTNVKIQQVVTQIDMDDNLKLNFRRASDKLYEMISMVHPGGSTSRSGRAAGRRQISGVGRDNKKKKKPNVRAQDKDRLITKGNKKFFNGVDVTDPTRNYPPNEWNAIQKYWSTIFESRPPRQVAAAAAAPAAAPAPAQAPAAAAAPAPQANAGNGQRFGTGAHAGTN